jgi:RHS repeat-associated protein
MPQDDLSDRDGAAPAERKGGPELPQISLPKGGGAIRAIGEKFAANPATGAGTSTIPVYLSPSRSGFTPQLEVSYNSGSGNAAMGFGWSLSVPMVTWKTDKGLPLYNDAPGSGIFILSQAEDLVPALAYADGQWSRDTIPSRSLYGKQYSVHRYRPRVDTLFARIEYWVNLSDPADTFWRSITRNNVTTWYGRSAASRIADLTDASSVFTWLICESYDDKGNVAIYEYKPENAEGLDLTKANERNRTDAGRAANRYLKRVSYGNRTPYFPDLAASAETPPAPDWCFELVFDYGEHDLLNPTPQDAGSWTVRGDPYSTHRSRFEIRTYRLCRRALMFHHFPDDPDVGLNCLVRSTDFTHAQAPSADPSQPFYSYLLSVTQSAYRRNGPGSYLSDSLPPIEFAYTTATVDETVRTLDADALENLPSGVDGSRYRWADLDGEGLPGVLTEQPRSWFYKANLSPANKQTIAGQELVIPSFAPMEVVARLPSTAALAGGHQQLLSVQGNGRLDLVQYDGSNPGFYERTEHADWESFVPFQSVPLLDWQSPHLKFVDLTGDGFPDVLISNGEGFWWHRSLGALGFASQNTVPQALDEEEGPRIVFANNTESIFVADMSGDGLSDIVRIRNGEVCYWPNLGYGAFGAKVTMDGSPCFDRVDVFDGRRIRLADIDGSGTNDLIYFASDCVQLYFNQSGNSWGPARVLDHFPTVDSGSMATVVDLLGNGTACLVWSSSLPANSSEPLRYIDLMGGQKPHLLVHQTNNLGATTAIRYAPSTRFYVADKLDRHPWVTRLPFPVHVVEQVETYDYISRNLFVSRYTYHHGYYDGVEREFRGFGRVDQYDSEEFATLLGSTDLPQPANLDDASDVPPILTKTWFHTGAYFGQASTSRYMESEYYSEGDSSDAVSGLSTMQLEAMLLDDTPLPASLLLADGSRLDYDPSPEELREGCRALRGSILRQEIYGLDNSDRSDRPYSVSERNYTIEMLQPRGPNPYAAFFSHPREAIEFNYERQLYKVAGDNIVDAGTPPPARTAADPRVSHSFTLAVDPYGNVLRSASVAYGRRYRDPALDAAAQANQKSIFCTCVYSSFTEAIDSADVRRNPLSAATRTYELLQAIPAAQQPDLTNLFRFDEMAAILQGLEDGLHDIPFENISPTGLNPKQTYRRQIGASRTYYRPDDLGAAAGDPRALLGLGTMDSKALPGASYKLAFTPGLISQVYQSAGTALLPAPAGVLGSTSPDGGGYVDLDEDGCWWMPTGRTYYMSAPGPSIQELKEALAHFYLPRRVEDPFGSESAVDYDGNDLLVVKAVDAVQNTVSASINYRVLAPKLMTDANGNQAAAAFDVLGLVTATALMGKDGQNIGDTLTDFNVDLSATEVDSLYKAVDPRKLAAGLLGNATTRFVYDVHRFYNSRRAAPSDPTQWLPVLSSGISRETHVSDLQKNQQSRLQIAFSYSDGFGREIQKKIQAEPGPVVDGGPVIDPRWVGSGWTIFNNKGKPVRKYEPFFSQLTVRGHQFEFGVKVGVSPILAYDPPARVVLTIYPNHTYEKVVFDPWLQFSWDANDNVLQADPTADTDVGDYFKRLPSASYSPTWYVQRAGGARGAEEQDAAAKAVAHAGTPKVAYFDSLGRTFLTIADNGAAGKYSTDVELDVQNNQRTITDELGRKAVVYDYDMLNTRLHQSNMEAGESWMLNDAKGKTIRSWDSRGHNFRNTYDLLRRPVGLFVLGTSAFASDPRTTAGEVLYDKIEYGEGQNGDQALNLRTRIFRHRDTAGVVTNQVTDPVAGQPVAYDFKGNLLGSSRQFVADQKSLPDWSGPDPAFLPDSYVIRTSYDALNRTITATEPDGSLILPTYNEANLLETVGVSVRGAASSDFVSNIDYNAKGQRILLENGNKTRCTYSYDPSTFRLANVVTTRAGFPANQQTVQDLSYTYDPMGNITHIQDNADIQNTVYFRNKRVEPSADYTYDAIYRLIQASGREQLGLVGDTPLPPTPTSYNDIPRIQLPHPGDGKAMGTYTEQYQYDAAGNFLSFIHRGSDPADPGWTRSYTYKEPSQLEPARFSNRLSSSAISGNQPLNEPYTYDQHGNMTSMPQLQAIQWDFRNQLFMTQRQAVNAGDEDGKLHQGQRTYYVYDPTGERVRKTTESAAGVRLNERLYLGLFEIYREYDSNGAVTLARETVHVMDDKKRIALLETKAVDSSVPLSSLPGTATRYQFDNHLGTACLELDEAGVVITYEEYYPFGSTSYQAGRSAAEASLKRYRYSGKERDEESGLYYQGARYYLPWLGRWAATDPIWRRQSTSSHTADDVGRGDGADSDASDADGSSTFHLNLYEYVNGRVTFAIDLSGLSPVRAASTTVERWKEAFERKINISGRLYDRGGTTKGSEAEKTLEKYGETQGFLISEKPVGKTNWMLEKSDKVPTAESKRYIYTKKGGWIDMVHFLFYAGRARINLDKYREELDTLENRAKIFLMNKIGPDQINFNEWKETYARDLALQATSSEGRIQEFVDDQSTGVQKLSAYSYEDLPSDKFGADFAIKFFDPNSSKTLAEQIDAYLQKLDATEPEKAPNWADVPEEFVPQNPVRNYSDKPMYTTGP